MTSLVGRSTACALLLAAFAGGRSASADEASRGSPPRVGIRSHVVATPTVPGLDTTRERLLVSSTPDAASVADRLHRRSVVGSWTTRPVAAGTRRVFLLETELERDNGAANGDATLLRLLPAYEGPHYAHWKLQHLDMITLADAPGGVPGFPGNPTPVPGPRTFGLGDLVHASFFVPKQSSNFIVGVGAALGLPTATDDVLGSGKWSAGPALRVTYRKGPWNLGALAAQRWSFAGASSRAPISQLMLRGAFRRQLGPDWFLVSAPIITANWRAASGQRWLVPLGGGLGRKFKFAGLNCAVSLQGYANVVKPTGAPDWSIRLGLTTIVPLRN